MPLTDLDHYLVLADNMEATRNFYVEMLGLTEGDRPRFGFPGYWLYLGDEPCVHIATRNLDSDDAASRYLSRSSEDAAVASTGAIDHLAFRGTGLIEIRERLLAGGFPFNERQVDREGRYQLFFDDPNGVKIELNFPSEEAAEITDKPESLVG